MNELGETAVIMHLRDEPALAENLVNVDRSGKLKAARNENIGVHGSGSRNLERVLEMVPVELLAPTTDENDMLEHVDILQIMQDGIEEFKFFVHGVPFVLLSSLL